MKTSIVCLMLLAVCALLVSPALADNPKSYNISIAQASKIGTNDLKPGNYKLVIDTAKVRFVETQSGKSFELNAKVLTAEEKFEVTEVHSKNVDGVSRIVGIRLGGTKTTVEFE